MRQLADYAMIAFMEAVKKGFPIYAKKFMSDVILVRNRHGRGILYVNYINMSDSSRYITVAADKYSVWGVRVVRIKDGEIIEVNEHLVPDAIGQHIELISTYEVDVWSKRLELFNRRHQVDDVPDLLRPFERMGARIMYIDDIFDYLVVFDDVVPVWYNKLTGKIDDSREWLKAMGLLPRELENVELKV